MIPSHILFELVDAQVGFKVTKRDTAGYFAVSRAKDGKLKLEDGHQYLEGNATEVLGELNYLLCQEMVSRLTLSPEYEPSFDVGQIVNVTVVPEAGRGVRTSSDTAFQVKTSILASSSPTDKHQKVVYESNVNGAISIHVGGIAEDTLIDMMQVSRCEIACNVDPVGGGYRFEG